MTNALTVHNLKKRYRRSGPWVINDLTCHVPKGSVCALIGPNGAGKTTTIEILEGHMVRLASAAAETGFSDKGSTAAVVRGDPVLRLRLAWTGPLQ